MKLTLADGKCLRAGSTDPSVGQSQGRGREGREWFRVLWWLVDANCNKGAGLLPSRSQGVRGTVSLNCISKPGPPGV